MKTPTIDYLPARDALGRASEVLEALFNAAITRLTGAGHSGLPDVAAHLAALTGERAKAQGDDARIARETLGLRVRRRQRGPLDDAPGLAVALLAQVGNPARHARADALAKPVLWRAAGAAAMLRARGGPGPAQAARWLRTRYLTGARHYPDLLQPSVFWMLTQSELLASPWREVPGAAALHRIIADLVPTDARPPFIEQLIVCEHARLASHPRPAAKDSALSALPLAGAEPYRFHNTAPQAGLIPDAFIPYFSPSSGP